MQLNNRCADGTTDCTSGGDAACAGIGNERCGFATHRDWRIPKINAANHGDATGAPAAAELETVINPVYPSCTTAPCTYSAFNTCCAAGCTVTTGSCTQSSPYWSATTWGGGPPSAWDVDFSDGNVYGSDKTTFNYVRAVRWGS